MLRWAGVAVAALFGLGFVLIGGGLQASIASGEATDYATAQPCAGNVTSSTTCYFAATMRLAAIEVTQSAPSSDNLPIYALRLEDGAHVYRAIVGEEIAKPPRAGDQLQTRVWRGRVVEIVIDGRRFHTYAYPSEPPGWLPVALIVLGLGVLAGAGIAALSR